MRARDAALGEDLDHEPVAVAGQRAVERRAIALADHGPRDAGADERARGLPREPAVGHGRQLAHVGLGVAGLHHLLEPQQQADDAVDRRELLGVRSCRLAQGQDDKDERAQEHAS